MLLINQTASLPTLPYVSKYGMIYINEERMMQTQKITAHIPVTLLHEAQTVTGKGITDTIKIALNQLAHAGAYDALRKMRGQVKFSIDLEELRKDR